ncbi:GNAT family N-acetyltransferase [Rhodospira trueperi]|uniref:Acetyltransferase (GNAT) domain-containing protein n=1 Tax=Rhodospira trueperi TaxID=69960 RepID=A0A1G7GCP9_9PROT|nr:GNAT family N-acetyltransferase [Rhodospira trueperi]SDE85916.1 Acetyltransferase (GNAT) domain-containing protein [Rhodospira trueperi]
MRLLAVPVEMAAALADHGFDALPPGLGISESRDFLVVAAIATQKLYAANGHEPPWIIYLAIDPGTNTVVGSCGFKAPCRDGTVEIASFTFPPFRGYGHGTAMTEALLNIARARPDVRRVIAHTRRRDGPACQILRGRGFQWSEPVDDPENGSVWRWIWASPPAGEHRS